MTAARMVWRSTRVLSRAAVVVIIGAALAAWRHFDERNRPPTVVLDADLHRRRRKK